MSEVRNEEEKAAAERRGPASAHRGGPPHAAIGMPTEKSQNFLPSAKRVLALMAPERLIVWAVVLLALGSVALNAIGPKILGSATDLIFAGVFSRQIPAGVTQEQAVQALRARGETQIADMLAAMQDIVPGTGIDFGALGRILLIVLAIYVVAALLQWLQGRLLTGAVNRTIFTLRRDVEDKLNRLPLPYVDGQPRGELLSRVTNDIDNVAQSLQQTLSQLLTSLLTVVAMVGMMIWISPLLALIALVTIPVTMVVTAMIGKRSQKHFVQQWKSTGEVNAIVEESFTGHELVKVFGRQAEADRDFAVRNDALHHASFRAQFISGIIMPTMMFIGNLNYVAIAVVGGLRVASGSMSLGDVQAFIQYSRQFTQPLTTVASMVNLMQSGVASAERVFAVLDAEEQEPDAVTPARITDPRGRVAFEDVSFSYREDTPLIENLDLVVEPGQTVAIVGPTGAGKTTLVNLVLRFYELNGGRITLDGVDITARTSPTGGRGRPTPRCSRLPGPPTSTGSCTCCPTATTPCSTPRPTTSAPVNDSSSPSPGPSSRRRRCSSSTRRRRRWTPAPSCSCSTRCRRCGPTARASSSPTDSRRSGMPTSSSSWSPGESSSGVHTPNCSPLAARSPPCTQPSSLVRRPISTRRAASPPLSEEGQAGWFSRHQSMATTAPTAGTAGSRRNAPSSAVSPPTNTLAMMATRPTATIASRSP